MESEVLGDQPDEQPQQAGRLRRRRRLVQPLQEGGVGAELVAQPLRHLAVGLLDLGQRQLLARARARDLQVEVAAEDAGQRDRDHRPEADGDEPAHLERAVEHHEQRTEDPEQDVEVEPLAPAPPAGATAAGACARSRGA